MNAYEPLNILNVLQEFRGPKWYVCGLQKRSRTWARASPFIACCETLKAKVSLRFFLYLSIKLQLWDVNGRTRILLN